VCGLSIKNNRFNLSPNTRFLIGYFFWFLFLFGVFYWGKYWSYSPIGKIIDFYVREAIMAILDSFLQNKILNYDIIINSKYHIVITPECNGLIPYFILLSAILAYGCSILKKIFWAILGFVVFFIANIIRLIVVVEIVNIYGSDAFYYIHDIAGNIFLVIIGMILFTSYLKRCDEK
jgi:exosortase/archaeosortase family protein